MARPSFIRVDSNVDAIAAELAVRDPKVMRRATVSGLNRAMTVASKAAIGGAAKAIGIKPKLIRDRTKRTRASARRLIAVTSFAPRGLNPLKIGMTAAQADAFYKGPRAPGATAFVMRVGNGSQQAVVRLPGSVAKKGRDAAGRLKKGRLPVQSIRILIGKETIRRFNRALETQGPEEFDKQVRKYLSTRMGNTPANQRMKRIA